MDGSGQAFRRALDEIFGRESDTTDRRNSRAQAVGPGAGGELGPVHGAGGEARWGLAMGWAEEPAAHEAPSTAAPLKCVDLAKSVRRELGLRAGLTREQMAESWRAFVKRHHPDRQPAGSRDEANARVALANALYDRARRSLPRP